VKVFKNRRAQKRNHRFIKRQKRRVRAARKSFEGKSFDKSGVYFRRRQKLSGRARNLKSTGSRSVCTSERNRVFRFRPIDEKRDDYAVGQANNQAGKRPCFVIRTIKKYEILRRDFQLETGEITPTLKLKRDVIGEKFQDLLAKLYG